MNKKEIKIFFIGFWEKFDFQNNFIANTLRIKYTVVVDSNPDYLFFTRFDSEVYKYNCVRIFYNMENFAPDFNLCDYAIGYDEITFGDRYLRYPLYLITDYSYYTGDNYALDFERMLNKNDFTERDLQQKDLFCGMVVSRGGCREREEFFDKLSQYKMICSGGSWKNNIGGRVADKYEFLSRCKFSIAFENSSTPGYTTEKLMQAFASKTLPIYFGNPHIANEFNPKAFINAHDFDSWEQVVSWIQEIDTNDELYLQMMRERAIDSKYIDHMHTALQAFLYHIIEQDPKAAIRRHGQVIEKYELKYKIGTIVFRSMIRISGMKEKILHPFRHK